MAGEEFDDMGEGLVERLSERIIGLGRVFGDSDELKTNLAL